MSDVNTLIEQLFVCLEWTNVAYAQTIELIEELEKSKMHDLAKNQKINLLSDYKEKLKETYSTSCKILQMTRLITEEDILIQFSHHHFELLAQI